MSKLDDLLDQETKAELVAFLTPYFSPIPQRTLIVVFDSAGAGLVTGIAGDVKIDYNCRISSWTLTGDAVGDLVVDIWRSSYDNFPPTIANTICGGSEPTLATEEKATDHVLLGWQTYIHKGDHLRFNIDSVSALDRATLTLELRGPL